MEYTEEEISDPRETYAMLKINAMMEIDSMSVYELLDADFMIENTDFDSLGELVNLAGTSNFNSPEWEDTIFQYTNFLCWKDMLEKAKDDMLDRLL